VGPFGLQDKRDSLWWRSFLSSFWLSIFLSLLCISSLKPFWLYFFLSFFLSLIIYFLCIANVSAFLLLFIYFLLCICNNQTLSSLCFFLYVLFPILQLFFALYMANQPSYILYLYLSWFKAIFFIHAAFALLSKSPF
jgi:hypothetical protein